MSESQDEGETGSELSDCLDVIFDAVEKSSLAPADKILYAIDACLEDDYDLLGDGANKLIDAKWTEDDWRIVAERLAERLQQTPADTKNDDFSRNYRRECLTNFLADAMERAGRGDGLVSLYETEARATGSYQRLVDFLIQQGELDDAVRWAGEGIEKVHAKYPGISAKLAESICEVARQRKQWDIVAAHAAVDFFTQPNAESFHGVVSAAKAAGCEKAVCAAAQRFLETGESPFGASARGKQTRKSVAADAWPLPLPSYLLTLASDQARWRETGPRFDVLLEIAILEKRPDDVLRWYEAMTGRKKHAALGRGMYWGIDSQPVAKAVASTYPDRALEIYRHELDSFLPQAQIAAYERCVACLRAMRAIYKSQDRENYWSELLADIHHKYRNRPRFIEMLERLAGRTIVQSLKSSTRR